MRDREIKNRDMSRWNVLRFMLDPRFRRDPYPLYARLREWAPVHTAVVGATIISSHAAVMEALRHPHMSNSESHADFSYTAGRQGAGQLAEAPFRYLMNRGGGWQAEPRDAFIAMSRNFLTGIDAPHHTRLRGLVARAFTPRVIADATPVIEKIAHELIDQLEPRRSADLLSEYAYELPVRVICRMLGVPAEDFPVFHRWVVDIVARFDLAGLGSTRIARDSNTATKELTAYLLALADNRRAEPRDDLISRLVELADDGDALSEPELVSVVALLLAAGHETTANLIGTSAWHLSRNPGQLSDWKQQPDLRRNGVEELLRFDSSIQLMLRITTEACEIGGVEIARGRHVIMLLGAANRDPERFSDPDRLDLGRPGVQAISFGFGAHHCIGAALARAEGEIGLGVLYDRLPNLRPTVERPEWRPSIVFRGLKELPVRWD